MSWIGGDDSKGALRVFIDDWLRASWPVRVHFKHRKTVDDALSGPFGEVGTEGHWFPVRSCVVCPGEHDRGAVYTNIPGLKHGFIDCSLKGDSDNIESQRNKDARCNAQKNLLRIRLLFRQPIRAPYVSQSIF